jgi:hypothetical protein
MTEPSSGVSRGDLGEPLLHRFEEGFVGARSKLSKDVLDLGERLLYGVQVRRVGGTYTSSAPLASMSSLILFGLCAPRLCPSPPPALHQASAPKSARRRARNLWRLWLPQNTSTLPFHVDSSKRSKSGCCPCSWALGRKPALLWEPESVVDPSRYASRTHPQHQSPNVETRNQPLPQSPRSLVAFSGYLRLFLSGHSPGSRAMERLIVASETSTPVSSKKAWQCSLRVRSGLDFSCWGSHSLNAWPLTEGLPGILWMSTSPVWRLLFKEAFDGRAGDSEEILDLPSRYAAIYCGERLQSEVPRISVHGDHSRAGSLLMQTAVRTLPHSQPFLLHPHAAKGFGYRYHLVLVHSSNSRRFLGEYLEERSKRFRHLFTHLKVRVFLEARLV